MATQKHMKKSKRTRKYRGGNECNLHKINCSLLGIRNPDTVTMQQADNAYMNTLSELKNASAYKKYRVSIQKAVSLLHTKI